MPTIKKTLRRLADGHGFLSVLLNLRRVANWWLCQFYPHRYWSEQYLLTASLLAGHCGYEVILPNSYISTMPRLANLLDAFWKEPQLAGVSPKGSSFWMQTR